MTTMKYSFYRMNLKYDKYGQPNIAQQQNSCKKQYNNKYLILI